MKQIAETGGVTTTIATGAAQVNGPADSPPFIPESSPRELGIAIGVKVVFITEGHRLERQDNFTGLVHRLDGVLETRRGCRRAEMTTAIYDNCYTCWNGCPTDASDVGGSLGSLLTDADGLRLASNTAITNVDVVNTCGEICTGCIAHCNVEAAGCVV